MASRGGTNASALPQRRHRTFSKKIGWPQWSQWNVRIATGAAGETLTDGR
jgi:hypothetical protein